MQVRCFHSLLSADVIIACPHIVNRIPPGLGGVRTGKGGRWESTGPPGGKLSCGAFESQQGPSFWKIKKWFVGRKKGVKLWMIWILKADM